MFENDTKNVMLDSLECWDYVINDKSGNLKDSTMILFLNKTDLFKERIKIKGIRSIFKEYKGKNDDLTESVSYIKNQYLTRNRNKDKIIYSHVTLFIY